MEFVFRKVPAHLRPKLIGDGLAEVPVKDRVAVIDESSVEQVSQFRWELHGNLKNSPNATKYARTRSRLFMLNGRVRPVYMHRLILGFPLFDVDHIDRNGLNNTRLNLRAATPWQNSCNAGSRGGTSKFVGVHFYKGYWVAQIRHKRKLRTVGHFKTEHEAAVAYDEECFRLRGRFACLNFPDRKKLNCGDMPAYMSGANVACGLIPSQEANA